MSSQIVAALIAATSALLGAMVAAAVAYGLYRRQRKDDQERLLNALFGELANIYQHYRYASPELPKDTSDRKEVCLRLRWATYGALHSTEDLTRYGFLSDDDVRGVLQLALRVRNNDLFIDFLLKAPSAIEASDLAYADQRMSYAIHTAQTLINGLVEKHPRLQSVLAKVEEELSADGF